MSLSSEFSGMALPLGILFLPTASLLLRYGTLRGTEEQRAHSWSTFLGANQVLRLAALLTWCTVWTSPAVQDSRWPLFWVAPLTSTIVGQITSRMINRTVFRLRWTAIDILRQAFWGTAHPSATLLLIASGFYGLFERRWWAVLWLAVAVIVALGGTVSLRIALGMKLRKVKSGTLYGRAMHLAKKAGVKLKRVYVVPPGRGDLTNAFGSSESIAMTDNFGEYLHGPQLDFVIGHELAHAKNKHTRKKFIGLAALFSLLALFSLMFAPLVPRFQPLLLLAILLVPLLAFYAVSRRFEYECDRDAVLFTGNPEAGMRALAALYQRTGAAIERSKFLELFMTHPNLLRRISAIARVGHIPETRVSEILFDSGVLNRDSQSRTTAAEA